MGPGPWDERFSKGASNVKRVFVCAVLIIFWVGIAHAQNIAGDWQGTLKAGPAELRLVLHIAKNADGSFKATLDSVDQGANGIPVTSISLRRFEVELYRGFRPRRLRRQSHRRRN